MRDNLIDTFISQTLNCQFRLLKVVQKSSDKERRTPGYAEIDTDCFGTWEPVANTMMTDPMGRLINIDRRLYAQMLEVDPEQPSVNDRIVIQIPSDMSGNLFTIKSAERYAEQYWSMMLERYKD